MVEEARTEPISPRVAFSHREFKLYQCSRVASTLAIQAQSIAVAWHIYNLTHRPLDLGYVGLAIFLPSAGLSLLAGSAADRFDRRSILVISYVVLAITATLLALLTLSGTRSLTAIYAVLVLFGAARAFAGPAGSSLLPRLVPREHFTNALTWSSTIWQLSAIAGPALGGLLMTFGARTVFIICAGLFLVSCAFTASLRTRTGRAEHPRSSIEELVAGVRYVFARRVILGAISLDLFAVLLGGAVALLPVYARDILHAGPEGLGLLRSGPAIGAAAMALIFAYRPLARRAGTTMLGAAFIFGVATIVFGLSTHFWLSMAALIALGMADMVSIIVRHSVVQLGTPDAMRGRVSAVNLVFIGASNELGEFESGLTASWLGSVELAVVLGGVGTCVVALVWARLFPELRGVDRLEDVHAKEFGSVSPPGGAQTPTSP